MATYRKCKCSSWSQEEEAKIKEIMATPIEIEGCKPYNPIRIESIRIMRRLEDADKWIPTDDPCQLT